MHHSDRNAHAYLIQTARARKPQAEYVRIAQHRAREREARMTDAAIILAGAAAAFLVSAFAFAMTV